MIVTSDKSLLKPRKLARQHSHKRVKIVHKGKPVTLGSKREYDIYKELLLREKAGDIKDLECQVNIELIPRNNRFRSMCYRADFVYYELDYEAPLLPFSGAKPWKKVVADCKGFRTQLYELKEKLFYHTFGYAITIIK